MSKGIRYEKQVDGRVLHHPGGRRDVQSEEKLDAIREDIASHIEMLVNELAEFDAERK